MADGELRFDTKIDTGGADKGIRTLKGAFNSLIDSFKNAGRGIDNAFGGAQSSKITSLNAKISQTEQQIQQLTAELQAMNDVGYTSNEFTQLSTQLEKAQASMYELLDARELLEERLKSDMIDLGFTVDDKAIQNIYENNLEWQKLTAQINQAELSLNRYEKEMLNVKQADSTVNVAATEQYAQKEVKLKGLIARLENYKNQLAKTKRAEDGYTSSTKKATKHTNKLSKSTNKANRSVGKLSKALNMLKMSLGLAVAFMAFQAVMQGIKEGFDNLAQHSDKFNKTLSSLMSAMTRFKNSIAAAFAPLVTAAMPYITTFINGMSKALDMVAQFTAALTGQSTYTKATSVQEDYAASLKDTSKAAKEATKSLYAFDELNVNQKNTDTSSSKEVSPEDMFTEGSIGKGILSAVDSFKQILADLFKPVKDSWDTYGKGVIDSFDTAIGNIKGAIAAIGTAFYNVWTNGTGYETVSNILILLTTILSILGAIALAFTLAWNDNGAGEALIQSIFDMLNAILVLINDIGVAFLSVWSNGTGQEMLSFILSILTNIINTVTNLTTRFTEAWNNAGTGQQIFQDIFNVINTLLSYIDKITVALSDWAGNIDFSSLLQSIETFTKSLEPLAGNIGEALYWFFTEVLLPLAGWVITDVAPLFFEGLANAIDLVNSVIEALQPLAEWLWENFLQPLGEWTGGMIIDILTALVDGLKKLSDWISEHQTLVENFAIIVGSFVAAWAIVNVALIIGGIVSALANFVSVAGLVIGAIGGIIPALGLLLGPIGLVVVAIGAVIAIIVLCIKHWDDIKETAIKVWDAIVNAWKAAGNWFKTKVTEPIEKFFTDLFTLLPLVAAKAWEMVCDAFKDAGSWFMDNVIDPIADGFNWLWDKIKEIINGILGLMEGFVNGIIGGVNFVVDAINSIKFDIPDWIPGIGGQTIGFSLPNLSKVSLPRLATGTVVPKSAGEFAAILGDNNREAEVVSPLSTMKQALKEALAESNLNNNSGSTTVNLQVDGKTFAQLFLPYMDKENDRKGVTLVQGGA